MRLYLSLILVLITITIIVIYVSVKNSNSEDNATYNWNLGLTKPLDYNIDIKKISYLINEKEIYRNTNLNSLAGWSGVSSGITLHNKIKDRLPDRIELLWEENETKKEYSTEFLFPKKKVLDYWNKNHDLLLKKWGKDYPKGQLSLQLGIAPGGIVVLWLSSLDINTTPFAIEVETYTAKVKGSTTNGSDTLRQSGSIALRRFGTPHFYTFEEKNIVAIDVLFHNGESNTLNLKKENNSILEITNTKRGWSLSKQITVHWFNEENIGYKSLFKVDITDLPTKTEKNISDGTHLIYLLNTPDINNGEWNKFEDKYIFQLEEVKRETIGR